MKQKIKIAAALIASGSLVMGNGISTWASEMGNENAGSQCEESVKQEEKASAEIPEAVEQPAVITEPVAEQPPVAEEQPPVAEEPGTEGQAPAEEGPAPEEPSGTEAPEEESQPPAAEEPGTEAQPAEGNTTAPEELTDAENPAESETAVEKDADEEQKESEPEIVFAAYEAVISTGEEKGFAAVYEKPDEAAPVIAQIAEGSHVLVTGRENGFSLIESGKLKGYVKTEFLGEPLSEPEKKSFYLTSEVPDGAKAGDIVKLYCVTEGYAEGSYELQWQYMQTDWFGNFVGEWTDAAGETGKELDIVLSEESVLKAWRVELIEADKADGQ